MYCAHGEDMYYVHQEELAHPVEKLMIILHYRYSPSCHCACHSYIHRIDRPVHHVSHSNQHHIFCHKRRLLGERENLFLVSCAHENFTR